MNHKIVTKKQSEHKKNNKPSKAFFFLRHNNDIDHITPVLYKWLTTQTIPTDVIITTKRSLLNDYRIQLLKKFSHARIVYVNDFYNKYNWTYLFNYFYPKYTNNIDKLVKKSSFVQRKADAIIHRIADTLFKGIDNAIVVFDWTTTYFVQQMVKHAKQKNFTTLSLPHGDRPYISYFETLHDLNYSSLESYKPSQIFDYVVVPNTLCFKRYEQYMEKNRIQVLGSPRYSDEWMHIINESIQSYDVKESKGKVKIVFFLRNIGYPIFWDEVVRTMKLILQFPEIYLVVKHHPRNTTAKKLTKTLLRYYPEVKKHLHTNIEFIYGSINSSSLMKWADIVLDLGTSVTWEAVKQKKPVLMLEYLHANYSTIAYYIKKAEIKCRDDLYDSLKQFIENKETFKDFYDEAERRRFIKEVMDVPDKKVLDRYAIFLKKCLDESKKRK
jgi:hypothetical protein